jgi:hypothetical protein
MVNRQGDAFAPASSSGRSLRMRVVRVVEAEQAVEGGLVARLARPPLHDEHAMRPRRPPPFTWQEPPIVFGQLVAELALEPLNSVERDDRCSLPAPRKQPAPRAAVAALVVDAAVVVHNTCRVATHARRRNRLTPPAVISDALTRSARRGDTSPDGRV